MTALDDQAMERARKRARQLMAFYIHITTYVLVGAFLVFIDLVAGVTGDTTVLGLDWAYWPILGWGIGVAAHAVSLAINPTGAWEQRKAEQIYMKERQRELQRS